MKEYRNSIRSRNMIKEALLELLKENNISKITVKALVEKSDLSRNTFYAHYPDIYSVLEDIEGEVIDKAIYFLDKFIQAGTRIDSLNFFNNIMQFVKDDSEVIKVLLTNDSAQSFIIKLKTVLINKVLANVEALNIKDEDGFLIFLDILFSGIIDLIKLYLNNSITISLNDIAIKTNKIFLAGYALYI